MNYKIIDDVLTKEQFKEIKKFILNSDFPWNLTTVVTNKNESLPLKASYYFTHEFWSGFNIEPQVQIFAPLLNKIECRAMMRVKANLYPSTDDIVYHDKHCDYDFSHKGAIFYLNTNNGLTILEDKVEVKSIENRLLLFDPSKPHNSTTCTDDKCRVNVNFNFF
jgi:hypothetical protein|tara:strand:+ start:508 stop:999 length:492 start_codon:yes stop_codon:yes gene_type:complete